MQDAVINKRFAAVKRSGNGLVCSLDQGNVNTLLPLNFGQLDEEIKGLKKDIPNREFKIGLEVNTSLIRAYNTNGLEIPEIDDDDCNNSPNCFSFAVPTVSGRNFLKYSCLKGITEEIFGKNVDFSEVSLRILKRKSTGETVLIANRKII